MAKQLEQWALNILARSSIEGTTLKLPQQLARDDYVAINKVLTGLGGKWNRTAGGHVFANDPAPLIGRTVESGVAVNRVQELQFFQTPVHLANRMVDLARIKPGDVALEPSAGLGRLVSALTLAGAIVTAVEIDEQMATTVQELNNALRVYNADFLEWVCGEGCDQSFDAVVMNPPFAKGQDIAHIRAAWGRLKVGGRLVAICGEGAYFQQIARASEFRRWLSDNDIASEKLPPETFKESGTGVNARLLRGTRRRGA